MYSTESNCRQAVDAQRGDEYPLRRVDRCRGEIDQRTSKVVTPRPGARIVDTPVPGKYKARLCRAKSRRYRSFWVPVEITVEPAERDEAGDLLEDENLRLTIYRRDTYTTTDWNRLFAYWTWVYPITDEEFEFMRKDRDWLNWYGTNEGGVDPSQPIDMLKVKPPF